MKYLFAMGWMETIKLKFFKRFLIEINDDWFDFQWKYSKNKFLLFLILIFVMNLYIHDNDDDDDI